MRLVDYARLRRDRNYWRNRALAAQHAELELAGLCAHLRQRVDRLEARQPITVDTLQLGHRAEQAEAEAESLRERHEIALRLLASYMRRFGDITEEATT